MRFWVGVIGSALLGWHCFFRCGKPGWRQCREPRDAEIRGGGNNGRLFGLTARFTVRKRPVNELIYQVYLGKKCLYSFAKVPGPGIFALAASSNCRHPGFLHRSMRMNWSCRSSAIGICGYRSLLAMRWPMKQVCVAGECGRLASAEWLFLSSFSQSVAKKPLISVDSASWRC